MTDFIAHVKEIQKSEAAAKTASTADMVIMRTRRVVTRIIRAMTGVTEGEKGMAAKAAAEISYIR